MASKDSKLLIKLLHIQQKLKAPKGQYNSFGKYPFRSAEDILEAVKPLCYAENTIPLLSDEIITVGDVCVFTNNGEARCNQRFYVKATASLYDCETGNEISVTANARESLDKKGMDDSQISGTACSYARKYAMNGLFAIDDQKDADTDEYQKQTAKTTDIKQAPTVSKPELADVMVTFKTKAEAELIVKKFEQLAEEGFIKQDSLANMQSALSKLKSENDYRSFIANCNKNIQQAEKDKVNFKDEEIPF